MSTASFSVGRLKEIARIYQDRVPLGWEEIQGIYKFLDHLNAIPAPPENTEVSPCPLCGMTRANHQPCPYCGC
jgi:hypothetical protein